jgi:hypothetical protein
MTTFAAKESSSFGELLVSAGLSPEIPEKQDIYGWLVGSWELDVRHYWTDMSGRGIKGEAHFERVLEGRAVQDVWIIPRAAEQGDLPKPSTYGTTLRVWDRTMSAWRVTWINPVTGARNELVGRRRGNDIVQLGTHSDGTPIRWTFTDITNDSFIWRGEALNADGETWTLQGEFHACRIR